MVPSYPTAPEFLELSLFNFFSLLPYHHSGVRRRLFALHLAEINCVEQIGSRRDGVEVWRRSRAIYCYISIGSISLSGTGTLFDTFCGELLS